MDWNHFFHKRDEWKRKAYEEIKQSLISVRENRFVRYDNSKEVHLVMIYGKSQVGKTTLILNMIGLKEEYFDEVYETLRAGISRGNSSTSTAIIYSKSNGEKYGCSHTSANDLLTKIEYFDKDGMRSHLEKIRDKVESNQISADDILKIYIPKQFFIREATVNSISIMDMPGIESRNHKEDTHVKNLMAKYIPISSVCIIACRSNDIQSLETMTLPVKLDWKRIEHRFILVVTHAYNDGTTKRYFKTERSKRNVGFYEYVKDTYTQEIRRVLGDNNRTEVYPVDVGDTLTRLCTDEITNIDDRIEIRDTKDQILSELRSSIISHKGERLKAALKDLEIVIEQFWEDLIKENKDQIKITDNKINTLKNSIIQTRNYKESLKDERKEIITYKQKIERIKKKIIPCKDGYIVDFSNSLMKNIKENGLLKKGREGEYLKDKNQVVLEKIREIIYSGKEIIDYFNLLNNTMKAASIEIDNITQMDFASKFENDCIPYVKNNFYPQKKGLFSKREKIYMNQINDVCFYLNDETNRRLLEYGNCCVMKINGIIVKKKTEISVIDRKILRQDKLIKQYEGDIDILKKERKELKCELDANESGKKKDQETLNLYLNFADTAYVEQRNEIVEKINESNNSEEKMLLILYLGLLDKDYQNVIGGIHEKSNK